MRFKKNPRISSGDFFADAGGNRRFTQRVLTIPPSLPSKREVTIPPEPRVLSAKFKDQATRMRLKKDLRISSGDFFYIMKRRSDFLAQQLPPIVRSQTQPRPGREPRYGTSLPKMLITRTRRTSSTCASTSEKEGSRSERIGRIMCIRHWMSKLHAWFTGMKEVLRRRSTAGKLLTSRFALLINRAVRPQSAPVNQSIQEPSTEQSEA